MLPKCDKNDDNDDFNNFNYDCVPDNEDNHDPNRDTHAHRSVNYGSSSDHPMEKREKRCTFGRQKICQATSYEKHGPPGPTGLKS